MCGINGIIEGSGLEARINAMNDTIKDRGPDSQQSYIHNNNALGHTRLSIVDVDNQAANQPMENDHYVLVFNGEIYNYKELANELAQEGVEFKTNSDTEVLLEGYSKLGKDILPKLNGQFAFAIYDKENGDVVLARDRTAMKPLYYSQENEEFSFSSNPRALVKNFEPDLESIATLLLNGSAFAAGEEPLGKSTYKGVESVQPGEVVSISNNQIQKEKYYKLPISDNNTNLSEEEAIIKMHDVLEQAIVTRIPQEVELGCALSGGLDSSIIAAVAANNYDKKIVASCIRYEADSQNGDYEHAKIFADMYDNIELISSNITPENFLDDLEEVVQALGIHDSVRQLAMFRNYKVLKENGVKVVLTGEGADEFNWGYWHKFPGLKSDQEACSNADSLRDLVAQRMPYVQSLFNKEQSGESSLQYLVDIYNSIDSQDSRKKMAGVYATDFLGFLNKANDRSAMAQSLEARCPFQDVNVIELSSSIPPEYQIKDEGEKYILREAFKEDLPQEIYARAKSPLPAASHINYHKVIADEFEKRIQNVDESYWNSFNKESFENISNNYNRVISELDAQYEPDVAGAQLMAWRPISSKADIATGNDIRTNDVFKLLTSLVWYDQNVKN